MMRTSALIPLTTGVIFAMGIGLHVVLSDMQKSRTAAAAHSISVHQYHPLAEQYCVGLRAQLQAGVAMSRLGIFTTQAIAEIDDVGDPDGHIHYLYSTCLEYFDTMITTAGDVL